MTSFVINTNFTGPVSLTSVENGIITQNGSVSVLASAAITTTGNNDIIVNGSVTSALVAIDSTGSSLELVIGASGSILSTGISGVRANVTSSTKILNQGTISGTENGLLLASADSYAYHHVINSGTISASSAGISIEARGSLSYVLNSGTIMGGSYGIVGGVAIDAVFEVWNTGIIVGSQYSFLGNNDDGSGTSSDRVYNAGLMQGDISLLSGDDIYDGRGGTLLGTVFGGEGNDLYIIDDSGIQLVEAVDEGIDEVRSEVNYTLADNFENLTLIGSDDLQGTGNTDDNILVGNSGDNVLRGRAGDDVINGGEGNDLLLGSNGADVISGEGGDDILRGGRRNDTLDGGDGDDILRGGQGNDKLSGGDGKDVLIGGAGQDRLFGGAGADTFVFSYASHSPKNSNSDVVKDFELGLDRIDFSDLISGTFNFIGDTAFSGTGPEVRISISGSNTLVRVDVDGDGTGDMKVIIEGVTGLLDTDFIL